ncbi:type 2 lantipeptide synthetase LanM [Nocardia asteroides]|nr:type 2 lantipeptide synthetase LanM [Nocardia asteroides]
MALIEFASGWKAVYKPRPFDIDAHVDFCEFADPYGNNLSLYTVHTA